MFDHLLMLILPLSLQTDTNQSSHYCCFLNLQRSISHDMSRVNDKVENCFYVSCLRYSLFSQLIFAAHVFSSPLQVGFGFSAADVSKVQSLVPPGKYIGDSFSESMAQHSLSAELFHICRLGAFLGYGVTPLCFKHLLRVWNIVIFLVIFLKI